MFKRWYPGTVDWRERFAVHAAKAPAGPLMAFYHRPPPSPECPLRETPLIAVDLETTGLDPGRDSIVSIGMIAMDSDHIHCAEARHWILKPDRALSGSSVVIHRITHSDIDRSPSLEKRFDDILSVLAGKVVVVHFAPVERRFLAEAARRLYGYPLYFPIIDTMELEKRHYRSGLGRWLSSTPSLRLDACRSRLHLPRYQAHHALTDALATAELLQAQLAHRHDPADAVSRFWM